jgi:hypothetical protein
MITCTQDVRSVCSGCAFRSEALAATFWTFAPIPVVLSKYVPSWLFFVYFSDAVLVAIFNLTRACVGALFSLVAIAWLVQSNAYSVARLLAIVHSLAGVRAFISVSGVVSLKCSRSLVLPHML